MRFYEAQVGAVFEDRVEVYSRRSRDGKEEGTGG